MYSLGAILLALCDRKLFTKLVNDAHSTRKILSSLTFSQYTVQYGRGIYLPPHTDEECFKHSYKGRITANFWEQMFRCSEVDPTKRPTAAESRDEFKKDDACKNNFFAFSSPYHPH